MNIVAKFLSWLGNRCLDASVWLEHRDDYSFAQVDWTDRPDCSKPPFLPDVEKVEPQR